MDISHIPSFSCVFVCTPHDSPNQIESDGDGHEHRMRFSFFMMHIIDIILLPLKCFLLFSFFCARKTTRTVFKSIILPSQKSQKVFMTTMSDSHLIKRGTKVITAKKILFTIFNLQTLSDRIVLIVRRQMTVLAWQMTANL